MARHSLQGSCHCARLTLRYDTDQTPSATHPRACDCTFCRKHGAAYLSDPAGALSIEEHVAGSRREYRQGSENARFQVCGHCGVLIAVVFEQEGRLFGAVNAKCLDGDPGFAETVDVSPQRLSADDKIARWLQAWIPDVAVTSARA
ncbi:MAG TPA: aldehyde-activating protein [Luteimonas sp.]|nr:aldehyde-activating protein [Luteimonas sp.]